MIDEEAASNCRAGMDFNSSKCAADMGYDPGESVPLVAVKKMGDSVHPNGMEARVAEEYLEKILGGRIPFDNSLHVFF
jgi:hypothetical protein